ncbi:UDP-Glycosyltransferase/glycogen phosphorylase [Daedaleopsis nitida]|nr:UDP-Glycosyltransferase/glycogen phosphorylase [Daedaleopsis nitida]
MTATQKHIACYATQAWGHIRPLCHLSARIVKLRPVTLTYLTTNTYYDRVKTELARSFDEDEEEYAKRIRLISIGEINAVGLRSDEGDAYFAEAWSTLMEEGELVCGHIGQRYPALPKPKGLILDIMGGAQMFSNVKTLSGDSVKVYGWCPGLTYGIFYMFGPESFGGKGNIRVKAEEEARRKGITFEEAVKPLAFEPSDGVAKLPGMPPMADYEYYPQAFPFPVEVGLPVLPYVYDSFEKNDGVVLFTPECYEPEAVAGVRAWFAETGRPVYTAGPLLPSASQATANANEVKLSAEGSAFQTFLDETLKTSGEKSLIYISFGSMFWPLMTPDKLWAFLDVLMERNHPFILSHASPVAMIPGQIPDDLKEKVKAYGKGMMSNWTPQQLILDHPATGWFVCHGGHNGVTESISSGVPMILWPFIGDQGPNAVHLVENLKIGYELLEVRSGNGLRPLLRNGFTPKNTIEALKEEAHEVLNKAFGEDGAKVRERLAEVQKGVNGAWEDGGSSKRDISLLIDRL